MRWIVRLIDIDGQQVYSLVGSHDTWHGHDLIEMSDAFVPYSEYDGHGLKVSVIDFPSKETCDGHIDYLLQESIYPEMFLDSIPVVHKMERVYDAIQELVKQ